MKREVVIMSLIGVLAGCAKPIVYNPQDFINPNKVVEKQVSLQPASNQVAATFGYGENPQVLQAYQTYLKSGRKPNVESSGFVTKAYNAHTRFMISCAPLHLCVVQLEAGENINNIELGDSADWAVHPSLIGTSQNGSYQVAVKPKQVGVATDMVITTTKRTYQFGLVSREGNSSQVLSFYYPEETLAQANLNAHELAEHPSKKSEIASSTVLQVDKLNFNYSVSGSQTSWQPLRIFDDGDKTFIEMPPMVERMDLPVLYIQREKGMALVNYRYKRPYYIVDGLFKTAYLIDGKGKAQIKVIICNHNIA